MADSKNKKNAAVAAAVTPPPMPVTPEPVKVKVYRPTPNRYLMQVHVPTGEAGMMRVALMRVKDSRFYRNGEMIPAMPGDQDIWMPLKQRFSPQIGTL